MAKSILSKTPTQLSTANHMPWITGPQRQAESGFQVPHRRDWASHSRPCSMLSGARLSQKLSPCVGCCWCSVDPALTWSDVQSLKREHEARG
ncbi:hypothetical protein FOBRF1_001996 [Fusarium oxysporum]